MSFYHYKILKNNIEPKNLLIQIIIKKHQKPKNLTYPRHVPTFLSSQNHLLKLFKQFQIFKT